MATWACSVCAVTAQEHPNVHFVGVTFEPPEKSAHSVPAIIFVVFVGVLANTPLAVNDELLIALRKILEGSMDIDLLARASAKQIFLRFTEFLPAKNANGPLCD